VAHIPATADYLEEITMCLDGLVELQALSASQANTLYASITVTIKHNVEPPKPPR
jgi:hypothetical protein